MTAESRLAEVLAHMIGGDYLEAHAALDPGAPREIAAAGRALLRLLAELPEAAAAKLEAGALAYDLAVHLKQRACFETALGALRLARASVPEDEAMWWNLAIVATGAGDVGAAAQAWKALGVETERGPFGLPRVPGLPDVLVRIGEEELRVRPESPVHGVVVGVPRAPSPPASYADLVLWDAAPIDAREPPCFPLLARLREGGARLFRFTGAGDLAALTREWPDALWLSFDGASSGKLVIEPELSLDEARAELARAHEASPGVTLDVAW